MIFVYCKCSCTSNQLKTPSILWHKRNEKETEAILPSFSQQSIRSSKVKATPEKVTETLELLRMDFSAFDKYQTCRNSKDGDKITTTSV